VVTLNWDCSIERAVEAVGGFARPIVLHPDAVEDALDAIREPGPELAVIHVHGVVDEPESLVLEAASNERLWDSRAVNAAASIREWHRHDWPEEELRR
jgi:hypothetical protein